MNVELYHFVICSEPPLLALPGQSSVVIQQYVYPHIFFKSSGKSFLGCLFSKCCLYVLGSGIWACKQKVVWHQYTVQVYDHGIIRYTQLPGGSSQYIDRSNADLAHGTHMDECLLCCLLLVIGAVALLLLHLRAFLGRLSLGLYLLLSTSHRGKNSDACAIKMTIQCRVSEGT